MTEPAAAWTGAGPVVDIRPPGKRRTAIRHRSRVLMALRSIRDASKCEGHVDKCSGGARRLPAAGSLRTDFVKQHRAEIPVIGSVCLNSANE